MGDKRHWRKAAILTDAIMGVFDEDPNVFSGHQLMDETYLRSKGQTDFSQYQCAPGHEPPKIWEVASLVAGAGDKSIASKK